MLSASCLYPYIFDTQPPESATMMTLYDRVPHPFALHLGPYRQGWLAPGSPLQIHLTLIGNACRHAAYFIVAFRAAAEAGIGPRRQRFVLAAVEGVDPLGVESPWPVALDAQSFRLPPAATVAPRATPCRALLTIKTPLRLKADNRLVSPERFEPASLLVALVRRVAMLMYFHGEKRLDADFLALKMAAARVQMFDANLRWQDLTRRSARHDTVMQAGGLLGTVTLDFKAAPELWPYLWLGTIVQAGKGTTMGLGACSVQSV
jgi:hypothetical protein